MLSINLIKRLTLLAIALNSLNTCSNRQVRHFAFRDVEYVSAFPEKISLKDGESLDLDIAGAIDLKVEQPFLLVSTQAPEGLINGFALKDCSKLGSFFRIGNGPLELAAPIIFSKLAFSKSEESIIASLYLIQGELLSLDIGKSLIDGQPNVVRTDSLPQGLKNCIPLKDGGYYCRTWNQNQSGFNRSILTGGQQIKTEATKTLDNAVIDVQVNGFSFNLVNSIAYYNSKNDLMVEAATFLNSINVYSPRGDYAKTICLGRKLDDITSRERENLISQPTRCQSIRGFGDYFACLYDHDRILLFGWDMRPIASIELPKDITCFDIDADCGMLYTLDDDEEIVRYDISQYEKRLVGIY